MKTLLHQLRDYHAALPARVGVPTLLLLMLLVTLNYQYGIESGIREISSGPVKLSSFYGVGLLAYGLPWLLYYYHQPDLLKSARLRVLILLAPFLFAVKMSAPLPSVAAGTDALYWNKILYWPLLCAGLLLLLAILYKWENRKAGCWGLRPASDANIPYSFLLLLLVPAVGWAAFQPDFLHIYPRLQWLTGVEELGQWPAWKIILFEGAYGTDFLSIEVFFRGFLVIGLARYAGPAAILPMASYYCVIHFGKPLAECVSAFGGGLLLGVVAWRTGSIYGGLALHLGLAWLMEAAGYFGHSLS